MTAVRGVLACSLACVYAAGCGTILGVQERVAPTADASDAIVFEDVQADGRDASVADVRVADAVAPQTLGLFQEPLIALGTDDVFVVDRGVERHRILRFQKNEATVPVTIYEQARSEKTDITAIAVARELVWFTTSNGALRHMNRDGTNPTLVDGLPSTIVASSKHTVWLVSPDYSAAAPTLTWLGSSVLAQTPEAKVSLGQSVYAAFGSDDELVFSGRTASAEWTVTRWRPFASEPLKTFARFTAYPASMAVDRERILVYQPDEGSVMAYSRLTPERPPTAVLVDANVPITLASDGINLVMLSPSRVQTCAISACASTTRTLETPWPFRRSRGLVIDERWAYFLRALGNDDPWMLVRVPRA